MSLLRPCGAADPNDGSGAALHYSAGPLDRIGPIAVTTNHLEAETNG
jgi:hypothetical protein